MVGCRTRVSTLILIATSCVLLSGCGAASPTSPGPLPVGHAGEWSGTTFQDRSILFTVSPEQQVTTISLGYQIDTCSGVDTFSGLNVPFTAGVPAFQFAAVLPDKRQLGIQGYLMPDGSVWGTLLVYGPPSCGPSEAVAGPFTARKR